MYQLNCFLTAQFLQEMSCNVQFSCRLWSSGSLHALKLNIRVDHTFGLSLECYSLILQPFIIPYLY